MVGELGRGSMENLASEPSEPANVLLITAVMLTFWLRRSGALGRGRVAPPPRGRTPAQGYGFSAVLVINRVSTLANFGHFGHK